MPQANGGTHACPLVPQVQVRVRRAARERNLRQWRGTHGIAGPLSFFGFVSWCSTTRDQVGVENVDISFRLCLTLLSTHRPEYSIICSKSVCKHGNIYKDAGRSLIMQAPCRVLQYSYAGPQTSSTTASAISPNQGRVLQVQQRIRDGAAAGRNSHLDGGTVCRFRQEFLGPGRASEARCGGGTIRRLISRMRGQPLALPRNMHRHVATFSILFCRRVLCRYCIFNSRPSDIVPFSDSFDSSAHWLRRIRSHVMTVDTRVDPQPTASCEVPVGT